MAKQNEPIKEPTARGVALSPDDKVAIWNHWAQTPLECTREVKAGVTHPFTCINAYYEFRKATELFGPCGIGWGWDRPEWEVMFADKPALSLLILRTRLWVFTPEHPGLPLINSQKMFFKDGAKLDDDIYKKLLTDTLTKGLSYLGCGADVFQGYFDDHRYIEKLKREQEGTGQAPPAGKPEPRAPQAQSAPQAQQSAPPPASNETSARGQLYKAIREQCYKIGATEQELKAHLSGHGYNSLGACPIPYLRNLLTKAENRAKAYAHAIAMAGKGDDAGGRERVARWIADNNIDMLGVEPATLLALAEDFRQVAR